MSSLIENLSVKGFAGIDQVDLEISRLTTLIGPQASGKSVAAKLLYFFRGVWSDLFYGGDPEDGTSDRKEVVKQQFKRYFPVETWGGDMFSLSYKAGEHEIRLRRGPSKGKPSEGLILTLPSFVDGLADAFKSYELDALSKNPRRRSPGSIRYDAWSHIEGDLKEQLDGYYFDQQLFVPAGRAFFSNIENNVFSFISRSEKKLDPFLTSFGEYYSYVKNDRFLPRSHVEHQSPLAESLLRGKFVVEKDKEFVRTTDGRVLPLGNLSSGQQEALPLLMLLDRYGDLFVRSGKERLAAYIEEPEAHLFPNFQRLITQRIAEFANAKNGSSSVFITTHSPYVLATINNLILAGKIAKASSSEKKKEIAEIVPQSMWLLKGDVRAYSFDGEGGCASVIDNETGLIDAEYLDSVSTSISNIFEELLDLGYSSGAVTE